MKQDDWVIVDTETTGLTQPIYAVEIAAQRMSGWHPAGEPFRILLNHDVPIEPRAEALHGYSRERLRDYGEDPVRAHAHFHEYCGSLPIVAYNVSFDWDRVLVPEYSRLSIPQTGIKGFCAMTLARRTITETENLKLETLKQYFELGDKPSHRGLDDVKCVVQLFETVLKGRLEAAGIVGFDEVARFSKKTPVAKCLEQIQNAVGEQPVWFVLKSDSESDGPYTIGKTRDLVEGRDCYVWREGMMNWELTSILPEFSETERQEPAKPSSRKMPPSVREDIVEIKAHVNELVGLCKGIVADGIITEEELYLLHDWIASCPCTHIYPISVVADTLEKICEDGVVTRAEQAELVAVIDGIISAHPKTG